MRIMVITRVMIETIKIPNENKSFAVMYPIGNAHFRGQNLTAYRCRLPLRVLKAPTLFYTISVYLSIKINTFDFRVSLNFLFRRYSFFMPLGCTLMGEQKIMPIGSAAVFRDIPKQKPTLLRK